MERNARVPHPVCGHKKPLWMHRKSGPCDWCLKDIEREFLPPGKEKTWEDIRARRRPYLEMTDWIETETHPERVKRSPEKYIIALRKFRRALLDVTDNFDRPDDVKWPAMPVEDDYK